MTDDDDHHEMSYHEMKQWKRTRWRHNQILQSVNDVLDNLAIVVSSILPRTNKRTTRPSNASVRGSFASHDRRIYVNFRDKRAYLVSKSTILRGSALAMALTSTGASMPWSKQQVAFDTDAFPVRIDNCASRTMSFEKDDFVPSTLKPIKPIRVKGFGSSTQTMVTHEGTVRWTILDDEGAPHDIVIPRSLYTPRSGERLLSPQHWAQTADDGTPDNKQPGTYCITTHREVRLYWDRARYTRTIPLDPTSNNVATMWVQNGFRHSLAFAAIAGEEDEQQPMCFATTAAVITDDEASRDDEREDDDRSFQSHESEPPPESVAQDPSGERTGWNTLPEIHHPHVIEQDKEELAMDPSAEMLRWHARLSHIPMSRIQQMAKEGALPARLAKCRVPMCQSCIYGKMTRRPWRTKPGAQDKGQMKVITAPGQCVSVDQLESTAPGLIAQMKGILTRQRYRAATVFVDHFSGLSYVHLQKSTNAVETLAAKHAFEQYAKTHGNAVLHYHADNGRFAENLWKQDVLAQGQKLTLCGVSAHHQNGVAEKRIRDLQDMARTSLIHANRRWRTAINVHLWPYALRKANESLNVSIRKGSTASPLELFTGVQVQPDLRSEHPFGCPAYVLDSSLQNRHKIDKWADRARLGIYIGPSPAHAGSVGLILSMKTGLVSPQFHVRYDNSFETIKEWKKTGEPSCLWQQKCGFTRHSNETKISDKQPGPAARSTNNDGESGADREPSDEHGNIPPTERSGVNEHANDDRASVPAPTDTPQGGRQTRSGRAIRPPARHADYVAYEVLCVEAIEMGVDAIAYGASSDPDVLYYHEAMAAHDREEFVKAMVQEVTAHDENGHWVVMRRIELPPGTRVLPAVWAMRRKRRIDTQEVYKWKARLNIHGGKQQKGIDFWETYAPVATWSSIRVILNIAAMSGWETWQLDFVLAYPQAPVETDLYMELPAGFEVPGESRRDMVLKLIKNLYGQKQAGRVWYKYLAEGLKTKCGFTQSENDPCVFWRNSSILVIYTDDTILTGPDPAELAIVVKDLAAVFKITSSTKVSDFLGVKITRSDDGSYTLTQPHLIDSILADLGLTKDTVKEKPTPALSSRILQVHSDSEEHNEQWHYRSVIGKLNFLEKSTRPDIAYAVHQCARFSESPRVEHSRAIKVIGRYLKATKDKGIICKPTSVGFECYSDADFAGNWSEKYAVEDSSTARSRSGFVIFYAGCPIVWSSKLQTEIALSSTESEYIALSLALREVLPLQRFVKELHDSGFKMINTSMPQVHCKAFEDNSGALEMATVHKMRPRTKHLNIKYHHFREAVDNGEVSVHRVSTQEQIADIFTKPLGLDTFEYLREKLMGW